MKLIEQEFRVQSTRNNRGLLNYIKKIIHNKIASNEIPVRFAISTSDREKYQCEIGILSEIDDFPISMHHSIFDFNKRNFENTEKFNAVLLIPTGIGAEIGGHCGDGNVIARLMASTCDTLITHPNVVNASDINEITENTMYVEGSIITRLLMGQIGLQKVRSNRILMLMDKHDEKNFNDEIINAVSSARVTLGINCDIIEMNNIIYCSSAYSNSGRAVGKIEFLERLFEIIYNNRNNYDAIALSTFIDVPHSFHKKYYKSDNMVNPWGGIEAMLTHSIAEEFNLPCAHAPMMNSKDVMNLELGVIDPRKAPESSSTTYLHCVLKGLHKSPKIVSYDKGLNIEDISCLIIPDGCIGLPTLACIEQGIPVIAVKENRNIMKNELEKLPFAPGKLFVVDNYLEAVGIMNSIKAGISIDTVRRPIQYTNVEQTKKSKNCTFIDNIEKSHINLKKNISKKKVLI